MQHVFSLANGFLMRTGPPIIRNVTDFKVNFRNYNQARTAVSVDSGPAQPEALVAAIEVCLEIVGEQVVPTFNTKYTNCRNKDVPRGNRNRLVFPNVCNVRLREDA